MAQAINHVNQLRQGKTVWMKTTTWSNTFMLYTPMPCLVLGKPEIYEHDGIRIRYKLRIRTSEGDSSISFYASATTGKIFYDMYVFKSRSACQRFCDRQARMSMASYQQTLNRQVQKLARNAVSGKCPPVSALYQPGLTQAITQRGREELKKIELQFDSELDVSDNYPKHP